MKIRKFIVGLSAVLIASCAESQKSLVLKYDNESCLVPRERYVDLGIRRSNTENRYIFLPCDFLHNLRSPRTIDHARWWLELAEVPSQPPSRFPWRASQGDAEVVGLASRVLCGHVRSRTLEATIIHNREMSFEPSIISMHAACTATSAGPTHLTRWAFIGQPNSLGLLLFSVRNEYIEEHSDRWNILISRDISFGSTQNGDNFVELSFSSSFWHNGRFLVLFIVILIFGIWGVIIGNRVRQKNRM